LWKNKKSEKNKKLLGFFQNLDLYISSCKTANTLIQDSGIEWSVTVIEGCIIESISNAKLAAKGFGLGANYPEH
jgi:hypothetical protein